MTSQIAAVEPEEPLPLWGWIVGALSMIFLIGLFLVCRAYSADSWAEDGSYGPAAQAARVRALE